MSCEDGSSDMEQLHDIIPNKITKKNKKSLNINKKIKKTKKIPIKKIIENNKLENDDIEIFKNKNKILILISKKDNN